jgi:hypothetical protein
MQHTLWLEFRERQGSVGRCGGPSSLATECCGRERGRQTAEKISAIHNSSVHQFIVRAAFLAMALGAHAETLSYWIEPGPDAQLAAWALDAWSKASAGKLEFKAAPRREDALIRIVWATAEQGMYGEARPVIVNGRRGSELYVRPAPLATGNDALLRQAITYLTCLHESGHALGLVHTAQFDDIMYNFQFGGDIQEYFARYRRKLHSREDIRTNSGISPADRKQLLSALGF